MLRCAHLLLLGTGIFLSSGCEKEIDLSTLPKDIEEGEPSRFIKFVNSFRGEVEVNIAACFQRFRLLSDQVQSVECLIEEDVNAFDVVVVWLNPPVGQGYAPPSAKNRHRVVRAGRRNQKRPGRDGQRLHYLDRRPPPELSRAAMGMLRVFLVLASAAMLGGCEEEIPLSTETTRAGEGAVELRVVNSFIDEMEITIAACQQNARIEAKSTAVIECLLQDASAPVEVEIAWPGSPLNAQGGSSFPSADSPCGPRPDHPHWHRTRRSRGWVHYTGCRTVSYARYMTIPSI